MLFLASQAMELTAWMGEFIGDLKKVAKPTLGRREGLKTVAKEL
jgi:hypothetical protein